MCILKTNCELLSQKLTTNKKQNLQSRNTNNASQIQNLIKSKHYGIKPFKTEVQTFGFRTNISSKDICEPLCQSILDPVR